MKAENKIISCQNHYKVKTKTQVANSVRYLKINNTPAKRAKNEKALLAVLL